MVYAGKKGKQRYTLGVSGRLMDRNLVMWDEETDTLWSQILGKALHGKSKGVELDMLPGVFVGFGTWTRMHPDTAVLDMSQVERRGWFYTSKDLARGEIKQRNRKRTLGIGLRQGGDTLAVGMPMLHEKGVVQVEVDEIPLALAWHATESAAFVYDRRVDGKTVDLELRGGVLHEVDGRRSWSALDGSPVSEKGTALRRFPYIPTYLDAWRTYYPKGAIRGGE